jgi:hypothetical protein
VVLVFALVAAAAPVSPARLVAASVAAVHAQRSVHYVNHTSSGGLRLTEVGDVGATRGVQRVTFRRNGTTGRLTVVVSNRTAYIRGDAFTLTDYLGLGFASATRYGGRWISIPRSDRAYRIVAGGVTLPSLVAELRLAAPFSRLRDTTIAGRHVRVVRGKLAATRGRGTAVVYLSARGRPLPLEETTRFGGRGSATFSRWNEALRLPRPTRVVPVAQVR